MKILIIGYGSIGRRHASLLPRIFPEARIHTVSRQAAAPGRVGSTLPEVADLAEFDYFVVASETWLHYEHLTYLDRLVRGKRILVEKPLFETVRSFSESANQVRVGYNLRFHPVVRNLRERLKDTLPLAATIVAGQYLPSWRPGTDYRLGYSARRQAGGGVALDLSHEFDYAQWIFGPFVSVQGIRRKVSHLEIDSDDCAAAVGMTTRGTLVTVVLDYLSRRRTRSITVHTNQETIVADLVENRLEIYSPPREPQIIREDGFTIERTYEDMHRCMWSEIPCDLCTVPEAMEVLRVVDLLKREEA